MFAFFKTLGYTSFASFFLVPLLHPTFSFLHTSIESIDAVGHLMYSICIIAEIGFNAFLTEGSWYWPLYCTSHSS
jgi:hypothetical protein